jgi:protein-S-isoprenylcysteine O-methyltransferase Ste14
VYNVLTNHGGVTYQFLVVDAKGHSVGGFFHSPFGVPWWLIYPLLLLLLLGLLIFAWLHRRKSRLQGGHV